MNEDMTATEIFNHISNLEIQCKITSEQLSERNRNSVDASRFYAVTMTTEEVAKFHGVSTVRVLDYAKRGLIEVHPNSTDAKYLFRASTVLTLDFDELKRKKLNLKR